MWFVRDSLGIALSVVTWCLLLFADVVVVRYVLATWFWTDRPRIAGLPFTGFGLWVFSMYQTLLGLSWFSHLQAMITDPGTIRERTAPADLPNPRNCKLCQGRWKPPRAHHCKTCQVCIYRMDHHCPWINNCVGLENQKLFILFLGYTGTAAAATLVLLLLSAIYWLAVQTSWSEAAPPSSTALILSGLVSIVCLAAILFVGDFLKEQVESIQMNSTLVETYQHTHGERTDFWNHFRSVFGHRWYIWPIPWPSVPGPFYREEAIPDDDAPMHAHDVYMGEEDTLGIAGEESEDVARTNDGLRPRQRYENDDQ